MMTMSKPLSAGQAKRYHHEQFRDVGENYYSEGQDILGQWDGRIAATWGLVGAVDEAHFTRLADGQHPLTGEPLVRVQTAHQQASAHGDAVHTMAHRAAWDLTISAPKSVSLTALVGGDDRVRVAHRQAVDAALRATEPYVQARIGGSRPAATTGRWVAATFEHDSARPVAGYAAPQLHTHVVVFNMTTTAEGQTRSLQPRELYRTQQYATAVYRSALATHLLALGYEIERGASGQPDIRGYTPEYLEASSPRRQQIEAHLDQAGVRGAAAAQIAAHHTRAAKTPVSHDEMRYRHRLLARTFGEQPAQVVATARQRVAELIRGAAHLPIARALDAVTAEAVAFARHRNIERDAVPHERDYLRDALSRSMGQATVSAIHAEFARQAHEGQFVEIAQPAGRPGRAYTTPAMIALEQRTIALMREGQRTQPALIHESTQRAIVHTSPHLSTDQRAAVAHISANRDRVQALEGIAGAGKTTVLATIREVAERDGYVVQGLAPTGRAAQQLAGAGMPTTTLQRHLVAPPQAGETRRLYVLDESSLASTTQMQTFLTRLGASDRVLLVGDARQHQAVDAGRPYEQLQEAGIAVARLHDIKRQQDPRLKDVVERLSVGDVHAALAQLDAQGRVHTIADRQQRLDAVAAQYLAHPGGTLVVCPDNQSRAELNARIRQELQATGQVARQEHQVTVLVPRQDLTGADRQWAGRYAQGDVVRYARGSRAHQVETGAYARVTAVDADHNVLTVTRGDGGSVTYDPRRLKGVMVYREAARAFAVGDRIQFTAPFPAATVPNREMGRITAITNRHKVRVRTDAGKTVAFAIAEDGRRVPSHRHLDHGYAVTSHSSQGLTEEKSVLYIDSARAGESLVNQRLAYVALSRGRHDAQVFSDLELDRLSYALSRDVSKSSATSVRHEREGHARHVERQPLLHERQPRLALDTEHVDRLMRTSGTRDISHTRATTTQHPADRGFSAQELQQARAYLELPAVRSALRDRETAHAARGRQHKPAEAPRIQPRHVAAVLRRLPPNAHGQYVTDVHAMPQTPALVLRAAGEAAASEYVHGKTQLEAVQHLTPEPPAALRQPAARQPTVQHSTGLSVGHGHGRS